MRFWLTSAAAEARSRAALAAAVFVLGSLVVLTALPAHAQSVAGGASLQIPPGARAEGMGRIHASVADDAFAPWWNPAGLAFMKGFNAGLMHAKLVPGLADDVYFEYAGGSTYVEGWGGVAGTITYLSYGESVATDVGSPDALGTFSSFEFSPSVAIGTPVLSNLGVGVNLKLLHVNLAPEEFSSGGAGKGTTFAADIGALYQIHRPTEDFFGLGAGTVNVGLGVTVANLGPDISLVDERASDPLPRNLKVALSGGAQVPESFSVLVGMAVEKSLIFEDIPDSIQTQLSFYEKNEVLLSGGVEFGFVDLAFARLGYIYDDPGEIKGFTYGAGFHLQKFGIDIASIPQFEELDRVTKISVIARFD